MWNICIYIYIFIVRGCCSHDRDLQLHFLPVSFNPIDGKVYSIQHYVIKFVSDFGFLRVLRFPPKIKTDCHNITEILLKVGVKQFFGGGNWRKPQTCRKSLTNL